MTRILIIAPTPFFSDRGCHVRIHEQAAYLSGRGYRVRALTYPIGNDPPGLEVIRARGIVRYEKYEAGPSWTRLILDAAVLIKGLQICKQDPPDLIHAHLHEGALIGAILGRRFNRPVVFDYQGSLTGESVHHGFISEGGALSRLFGAVEGWIDRLPARIITSAGVLTEALNKQGMQAETVGDGVDLERFRPGPRDHKLAEDLGLPDRPVAVFLGAMTDYQGVDIIIKAARLLQDKAAPVHFLIMGYPEQAYVKMAQSMGVSENVTFTGRVDYFKAADFLGLGSIALAPKLAETEANGKVLNYMARGLPVAAFDLPVNREMLGDHAVWVEPSKDRDQCARRLADGVAGLVDDPERMKTLSEKGRELAERRFSISGQGQKLEAVYRSLLGGEDG